jgi:competence protein ComEC
MVYDSGHWNGQHCINAVRELITGDTIDLMVISHSDADHLGDGARILNEKRVRQTILAGEVRTTGSWTSLVDALAEEVKQGGSVHNLQSVPLVPGTTIPLGEAVVTLVAGWPVWADPGPTESERRNAISVVVRLDYRGRSILFTGDTIGRRLTDFDDACKDAEKVMVDRHNAGELSLKADVLIASHHGGNNGSATCFIQAIDPQFVVFSSGHDHQHPTLNAANRFLIHGILSSRLFRTDFGDDEAGRSSGRQTASPAVAIQPAMMTWRLRCGLEERWMWTISGPRRGAIRGSGRDLLQQVYLPIFLIEEKRSWLNLDRRETPARATSSLPSIRHCVRRS